MPAIPGTQVLAPIVPADDLDLYPTHKAEWGLGGYRSVATLAARNAIPAERREAGMAVRVAEDGELYFLDDDLTTWFASGIGPIAPEDIVGVTALGRDLMLAENPGEVVTVLGLGTAAFEDVEAFDLAGAAAAVQASSLQKAANLSDLVNVPDARTNLGLGSAALQPASAFRSATAQQPIGIACGDETTAITAGNGKVTFHLPIPFTVTGVVAELKDAQVSGAIFTMDVNAAGATILGTKATIDNGEETSLTAAAQPVVTGAPLALAAGTKITVDFDQVGDGTAKGPKLWLLGYPTP